MTKAAYYIAALQNDDGGFSYQPNLTSNPELTAEIADILADCMRENVYLSYILSGTISNLTEYLEVNAVAIEELSADNLSAVYQHFHTALFELKMNGRYDVSAYFALQNEDGGVFDDPMATALFLELIVREQNAIVANLDYIAITNDRGYAVSSFNANENVNIEIGNEYESEKAYLQVTLTTPSGEIVVLDPENLIWNTADHEEGTYTVTADIIRISNEESLISMTQTFRIEHRLEIDGIVIALSQGFARVGDTVDIGISANIELKNFSDETDNVVVRWSVRCDGEIILTDEKIISESDVIADFIPLGEFTPDTSERKVYLITAEVLSNELVAAQSTTNFFVSDKTVALVRDVNKDFLYETSDDAEITVKIRDERIVDLIFTTSSDNTTLISQYADRIDEIKSELENLGYIVNICTVDTSYLTARDTFAWIEYDHPNYNTQAPYTQHIVYDGDNIRMLGYTSVPYKDFLLVPDNNSSQKQFTFDIQRDQTDWHSMNGGGFLFNTVIEDDLISGYYVLVTSNGLRLYSLDKLSLNSFRNSAAVGTLLQTFPFSNPYDEHHIKISADSHTLSLWDGENLVIDNYELPEIYGNGYGPITSHASHGCSQRSYFTFANITMQTITGEKLVDILDNYNFESPSSRYVINLSDNYMDNFDTEEEIAEIAQKIIDKNISFIGLGNEDNEEQYQSLLELITDQGFYYSFEDETAADIFSEYIISTEESKRVKIENRVEFDGHGYAVFDNSMSWTEAKEFCESLGGHLAVITSEDEQNFIDNLIKTSSKSSFWLGGYEVGYDNWKWITGEPWNYTNWKRGQPDHSFGDTENYLGIWEGNGWNDFTNNSTGSNIGNMGIICEWDYYEDSIIATDLVLTGILHDGTVITQTFDSLCVGETLEVVIPTELTDLVAGTDALLLENITLTYKDENGVSRTKTVADVILPVLTPAGKLRNGVSTDKPEYTPYQDVAIFDRIHNTSDTRIAKDMVNVITILNVNGEVVARYSKNLAEIMPGGFVERNEFWNTADFEGGMYTVLSEIYEGDFLVAESSAEFTIIVPEIPEVNLAGELTLSGKEFDVKDTITIDYSVENIGHADVVNAQTVIKIIDTDNDVVVYRHEMPLDLAISEMENGSISVTPQSDFSSKKGKTYLVTYEAVLEDGRVIPLAGDGFILTKNISDIIGDNVLFSGNMDSSQHGILMSGWKILVDGSIHSNTNFEANCGELTIGGFCDTVLSAAFNTGMTIIDNGHRTVDVSEIPDCLEDIRERLQGSIISQTGGWVSETDEQLRIYGNDVTVSSDVYSSKTIVIDPSNTFMVDNPDGILVCSEEDIIIRSTNVDFKGIIYAPNGTVRIESSDFNIQGRIIAKNIVYQGSVFTGQTFEGDLDLLG